MALEHGAGLGVIELDNTSGTAVALQNYMTGATPEVKKETADSTVLSSTARTFLFGLEDGGEMQVKVFMTDAAPCPIWAQFCALYNDEYIGTFASYPQGKIANHAKMSRECGVTSLSAPVQNEDGAHFMATLKAQGATTPGVHT